MPFFTPSIKCGGLLPMAVCQSAHLQLTHCQREQAPSHMELHQAALNLPPCFSANLSG
jgi:hypothetical protein